MNATSPVHPLADDASNHDRPAGVGGGDFAPAHRTQVFGQLLKREFWEHKGGFFWAPLMMSAVVIALTILASITGSVKMGGVIENAPVELAAEGFKFNEQTGLDAAAEAFGYAGDVSLVSGVVMTSIVLAFVVFFYALGSLYDDRKDRSVLFWKSMPVSDTQMVLSKAAWALVLAPVLTVVVGLALGIMLWLISAATASFNNIPGASGMFTRSHPVRVLLTALSQVPVYALWALPTIGWLLLCSAAARSKPFLWAVLVPVLGAVLVSWLDSMPGIDISHGKVWYVLVARGLLSAIPGVWLIKNEALRSEAVQFDNSQHLLDSFGLNSVVQALASADLWIGAIIGAVMIFAAIRLRRWRE